MITVKVEQVIHQMKEGKTGLDEIRTEQIPQTPTCKFPKCGKRLEWLLY